MLPGSGAYQRTHAQPGLYVKTPFVESVTKFDSRLLRVDAPTASLLTRDKKNLVIDSYARYKIVNPLLFFQSLRSELQAEARVGDIVASRLRREVALDLQEEIISETREQVMGRVTEASNRDEIELEILLDLPGQIDNPEVTIEVTEIREPDEDPTRGRPATPEEFAALKRDPARLEGFDVKYFLPVSSTLGIDIVDVRIKRADFPPDVATSVFSRMEAERERIASGLRATGSEQDARIRADVDRRVNVILESAQGESALLRGEAEQEAIDILAEALEKDPEFYGLPAFVGGLHQFVRQSDHDSPGPRKRPAEVPAEPGRPHRPIGRPERSPLFPAESGGGAGVPRGYGAIVGAD